MHTIIILQNNIVDGLTALFTKPSAGGWNDPLESFQLLAPFTAYGSFRNCTRQNHGTARNREAGGFVNSAVNFVTREQTFRVM